jgi:hypothetical protein
MKRMNTDPLLDLVVDAAEVDRERIANALRQVIAIDKAGTVLPLGGFQKLSVTQKILAFLLGRKVAVLVGLADEEAIGPTDLAAGSGLPPGTIYPTVRRMSRDRLVSQDGASHYFLSPHQVGVAIERLGTPDGTASHTVSTPTPEKPAKASKRTVNKTAASSKGPQAKTAKSAATPAKRQTSFSPTQTARQLVDQGFFDKPKTIADVQRRMKDKLGRDVAITTLSPIFTRLLRDDVLDRDKNADGAYEYVRAKG